MYYICINSSVILLPIVQTDLKENPYLFCVILQISEASCEDVLS